MTTPVDSRRPFRPDQRLREIAIRGASTVMVVALLVPAGARPLAAQDTLRLPALQRAAVEHDPRARQADLLAHQTALRLRNLATERMPQLSVTGEATYQSEVTSIPLSIPGTMIPQPPHGRFEVALNADWLIYDGGANAARRAAERAELAAASARLAAELEPLRMEVNEAFFSALALQEGAAEVGTLIDDLAARLEQAREGVRAGAALPGDTAAILAELLAAVERQRSLAAERTAWLSVLARLGGRGIDERAVLVLPVLTDEVARVRAAVAADDRSVMLAHPQFAALDAQREQLERQSDAVRAQSRPHSSAFGSLAFGRPGYEQFTDELHDYWIGGIRFRWAPLDWGRTRRERAVLDVQREIIDSREAAFVERLARESEQPLATMDRLRSTIETDDRIIELRAQVVRQARTQFEERAITAASYVDALTDLERARVTRALHRVQLAQAEATYLTMLGIELP